MRTCSKCKIDKDLGSFYKDKGCKDGVRRTCKVCDSEKFAKWRKVNHERHNSMVREWNRVNKDLCLARAQRWNKEHPEALRAASRMRKEHVRRATPPWADMKAIIEFYKNTPEGYHVDHIIPLRGKLVSGLHVLENLQYLLAEDNIKKSNKVVDHAIRFQ